ncbi:hypothetical protein CPB84DRAFT_540803 [Gymnopilus junonius]|uniref:Uncharacterized protein n=1 Tax=Gymnopilus junonius TaxID=109634 RepID=A0A9P5TRN7_GYMJU|nr:hypothetical protein CPB84DRAFT_540803 [Gymnopilus junonius]
MHLKSSRALVVFPSLSALAVSLMFGRFLGARMDLELRNDCQLETSSAQSYLLHYTGYHIFDRALCLLITFFHNLMKSPKSLAFLTYALGTGAPLVVLPLVEAYRRDRHLLVAYPVIWGLFTQVATIGVVFPIYSLILILTGGTKKNRNLSIRSFTQAEAEAMIFGLSIGAVIPSVAMVTLKDAHVTAIWQLYPLIVSIGQLGHLLFRPVSRHRESGYRILQVLYLGAFLISSSIHISTVWPIMGDFTEVKSLLLPSLLPLHPTRVMNDHLLDFLKWDIIISYSSVALTMLWFAKNANQLFKILLWFSVAIPAFGFGAAVMGVAIWRDSALP